jgi:hypothetical protein
VKEVIRSSWKHDQIVRSGYAPVVCRELQRAQSPTCREGRSCLARQGAFDRHDVISRWIPSRDVAVDALISTRTHLSAADRGPIYRKRKGARFSRLVVDSSNERERGAERVQLRKPFGGEADPSIR